MTKPLTHPTPEKLTAFSLGQLSDEDAEAVESHVGECEPCCETLLGLSSDDTFVELLQVANRLPSETPKNEHDGEIPAPLSAHPRYAVVAPVGKGGMGDVFKAEHRVMERTVALKVINRELFRKQEAVERFHREVKTAARLSHPNIVTAYDAEQAGDVHFLVMEYVDGVDLARKVTDGGDLPISEACNYIRQAALGLQHAHEQGMVHRDIKPHNLMVTGDGTVKILDFGLATLATEAIPADCGEMSGDDAPEKTTALRLTTIGTMMGTPDFISPEQAGAAHAVDIRSDIYSLGCTFYYLLSGRPPFVEGSVMDKVKAHTDLHAEAIENMRVDIPEEVAEVVRRMMAKDPAKRFQTPAEVADALAPFVDTQRTRRVEDTVSNKKSLASPPWRSWWPPSVIRALAFGASALILGAIIYVATDRGTLVVDSVDESVEIAVGRVDEDLGITDTVTGSTAKRLPSGEYVLDLKDDKNEFELSQNRFILKRGNKVIVKVTRKDGDGEVELQQGVVVRQVWPNAKDVMGAVSPNGRYVSFVDWDTGNLDVRDLILKTNRHVTNKSSWDTSSEFAEFSEFSPDGTQLAYAWFNKEHTYDLRIVEVEGGEPQVIYASDDIDYIQPMDWSPNGTQVLAVLFRTDETNQIVLVSVVEKTVTVLKTLDWRYPGEMSFSPDGKHIVYDLPGRDTLKNDLFVIATDGSNETPLIEDSADHALLGWSPDGKWILFASNRTGAWDAWLVQVENGKRQGEPMLVKPGIGDVVSMGFTSEAVFLFGDHKRLSEVCTASFDPVSGEIGPHKSVAQHALGAKTAPAYSRDGALAYLSQRGRRTRIVVLSASGQERELVPKLSRILPKPPAWSPDGRSLLVSGRDLQDRRGMFVVDINTGDVEQVVLGNAYGEWSPDGEAVYVYQPSERRIYRRELETKTERDIVQVPQARGQVRFVISPNGEQIAFTTRDIEKKSWILRVKPIAGGDDVDVYEVPKGRTVRRLQWTADGKRLVVGERVKDKYEFSMVPAQGGAPITLHLNVDGVEYLKMHPDGKQVALNVKQKGMTEISAMENFLPRLKKYVDSPKQQNVMAVKRVWASERFIGPGTISPDGRLLPFVNWNLGAVGMHDLTSGQSRAVAESDPPWSEWTDSFPLISPDGKHVVFNWYKNGYCLRIANIDGSQVRELYRDEEVPWLAPFDWSPDGAAVLTSFSRKDRTQQIALVSVKDGTARVLKSLGWNGVSNMKFSPDGRSIVYDRDVQSSTNRPANRDIFVLAIDQNEEIPLVQHPANDKLLGWAPDGKTILFSSNRQGSRDAFVVDVSGTSNPTLVKKEIGNIDPIGFTADASFYYSTSPPIRDVYVATIDADTGKLVGARRKVSRLREGSNISPDWSPDGRHLAYIRPRRQACITVVTLETEEYRELRPDLGYIRSKGARWSPDSKSFILSGNDDKGRLGIYQVNAESGETKLIRRGDETRATQPEWTPDGKSIVFSEFRPDARSRGVSIVMRNLDTGDETEILSDVVSSAEPSFALSPDGNDLVFVTHDEEAASMKVVSIKGGEPSLLHQEKPGGIGRVEWTPTGRHVIFERSNGKETELWRISVKDGGARHLGLSAKGVAGNGFIYPRIHPDGRQIAFAASNTNEQKIRTEVWALENFLPLLNDD